MKITIIIIALAVLVTILVFKLIKWWKIYKLTKKSTTIALHIKDLPKTMITANIYTAEALRDMMMATSMPEKYDIHLKTAVTKMITDIENRLNEINITSAEEKFPINLTIDKLTGLIIVSLAKSLRQIGLQKIDESKRQSAIELYRFAQQIDLTQLPE